MRDLQNNFGNCCLRRESWRLSLLELSAFVRFCDSSNGDLGAFAALDDAAKSEMVARSPLRVCRWRFPTLVEHVQANGGLEEPNLILADLLAWFFMAFSC